MRLSLVVPCYNEASNLPLLLPRCSELVRKCGGKAEVILVDNGSTDETTTTLLSLLPDFPGCRLVRVAVNQGYGFGILSGLRATTGDVLAWTHADMQTDPMDAFQGFELFAAATDRNRLFVKGLRQGRVVADQFFTVGMSIFETILLGCPLWDINAQPTMLSRAFFNSWTNPPLDFSFDLYAYYGARRARLIVKRIPVRYGNRVHGVSHWNVDWRSKWRLIHRTMDYSLTLRRTVAGVAKPGETQS